MIFWMLDADGEPVATDDALVWGVWMESADRHVLDERVGRVRVSTVFLGLDHNWHDTRAPVLWETMIFGGVFDDNQYRYRSRLDACRGHVAAVLLVELYRHAPRRVRKSVRKSRRDQTRETRGDARRVSRFLRRHVQLSEVTL